MRDFIVALIVGGVGLALLAVGYRFARVLIALSGLLFGFSLGGAIISAMDSTPFLGTALGIMVGLVLGLLFAALAYLYYAVAVIILLGSFGYWLGSSFILLFGFNPGVLSVTAGIALGVVVGMIALLSNAPKYVLIGLTSLTGAVVTISAVLLMFNVIPLSAYAYDSARVVIANSFIWTIVAAVLAVIGMGIQASTADEYDLEQWSASHDGHDNLKPTTPSTPRAAAM